MSRGHCNTHYVCVTHNLTLCVRGHVMDTQDIQQVLKKLNVSGNVYAVDMLPFKVQYPSVMVCNTDPHYMPGQHWIAICFDSCGKGEYFDPYGLYPFPPFVPFMDNNSASWIYNDVCLQSPLSQTCGQHCLAYIFHRCKGIDMNTYVKSFHSDLLSNDLKVYHFVNAL